MREDCWLAKMMEDILRDTILTVWYMLHTQRNATQRNATQHNATQRNEKTTHRKTDEDSSTVVVERLSPRRECI